MSERWLDYSGFRPNLREVRAAGATGVLRYLSEPVPATAWKRITVAEKDAILDAGLDLILNFEWYEGRMLEGRAAGIHDGNNALHQARALGYPKGATIYFSHDTSARDDAAILAYMGGAQDALGDDYRADIYSGYDVVEMCLRAGVARYGWQTLAWSNGRVGHAHIYQNGRLWFEGQADENVIRVSVLGSWHETEAVNGSPAKPPTPTPKPKPTPTPSTKTETLLYLVRKGDNLTIIAQKFHTTVQELVKLNPKLTSPNLIRIGELLRVPGHQRDPTRPEITRYRVVSGDTLSAIAKHFDVSVRHLRAWNPIIKNPNLIHTGWILRVQ